jgi:hypothetical protein
MRKDPYPDMVEAQLPTKQERLRAKWRRKDKNKRIPPEQRLDCFEHYIGRTPGHSYRQYHTPPRPKPKTQNRKPPFTTIQKYIQYIPYSNLSPKIPKEIIQHMSTNNPINPISRDHAPSPDNPIDPIDISQQAEDIESQTLPPLAHIDSPDEESIDIIQHSTSTKLTPTFIQKLRLSFSLGWDFESTCRYIGIAKGDLYDIINSCPILADYIRTWQLIPRRKAMSTILDLLNNSENESIRLSAAKFIIDKATLVSTPQKPTRTPSPKLANNLSTPSQTDLSALASSIHISISSPNIQPDNPNTTDISPNP